MIPRKAPAGETEATEAPAAPQPPTADCPNATTATVIDIPSAAVAHANDNVADELAAPAASKRLTAVPDAAVVLSVCRNLGGACTHPAHLYASPPALSLAAVADGSGCGGQPGQLAGLRHIAAAATSAGSASEKKYLADQRRCCPPPLFIILISLLEIGVFVYDYLTVEVQSELNSTTIPSGSSLIYRPDRRLQIWRFVSYMVLHANWFHLGFNVVIQLLYGLPLEMVHGSLRIAVIYLAGVFAGSLGTSVVDSEVYLVGASGGVYALLAAQLANILLNYGQMRYGMSQLVSVAIFVSCDLGYALYTKYVAVEPKVLPSVSYIAHVTGSLAGFTMGLLVLRNFDSRKAQSHLIWWLALGVYSAFTIFAIVFNLINTVTAQLLEEEGEVIKQHLLHDLGISKIL